MSRRRVAIGILLLGAAVTGAFWWSDGTEPTQPPTEPAAAVARPPSTERPPAAAPTHGSGQCRHPFVPSNGADSRAFQVTTGQLSAELTLELLSTTKRGDRWLHEWRSRFTLAGESEPLVATRTLRCGPAGAEAPWATVSIPGFAQLEEVGWDWPSELRAGTRFGGDLRMRFMGESVVIHRSHHVAAVEQITVPAGTFQAWRVEFREDDSTVPGQHWVARGVGLVRSELGAPSGPATIVELTGCGEDPCEES